MRPVGQNHSRVTHSCDIHCRVITLPQLYYNIGLLYQDTGSITKAKASFQEARALYQKIEDNQMRDEGMRKAEEALDDIE